MAEQILDSILDSVGATPVVRLRRIARGLPCEVLAKCEYLNPGGSVKDRIGVRMVMEAEKSGRIKPGDTLIEPTSGNTGIGMAMAAAVRGYRMIITMPEKMSREKQVALEALGAEIIRTPTEAAWDAPESHIGVAKRLKEILPNSHILDQYNNPDNPLAHYHGTGAEIVEQVGGKLDAIVMTAGTGGTLTGVARKLKEDIPGCRIVGVDPEGSILAGPGEIKTYKVEGIGYDFIPAVLDTKLVDEWIKSNDRDSFLMARRLIRTEGLLCGGSSGSAVWAALKVAAKMKAGQRVLVILPDSIRNYMTKFVDPQWMRENRFVERDFSMGEIGDVLRALPRRALIAVSVADTLGRAVETMKERGISQVPVLDGDKLAGILTESDVLQGLVAQQWQLGTKVAEAMCRRVSTVTEHTPASMLPEIFGRGEVAIVIDGSQKVLGLLTKIDLVEYLTQTERLQQTTAPV
ncbi:MAG TPA: cystathionine beta-synthase [Planctomycetota bacterium]|nr:cystathionine beta-synthase [Planctomycetota bacterium]